jgi:hypothetical protein
VSSGHEHVYTVSSTTKSTTRTENNVTFKVCWEHYVSKCSCGDVSTEWDGPESRC